MTIRSLSLLTAILATGILPLLASETATTPLLPGFEEMRDLIRTNVPGATSLQIERSAVAGLLQEFRGKVQLVDPQEPSGSVSNVTKSFVFDGGIAYLRVQRVGGAVSNDFALQFAAMNATNKLKGLVVDLRFATGNDYAAACATADQFLATEGDLLDWGEGMVRSSSKTNALDLPVVVLVNGETAGAPEALAALLREQGHALILGARTLGAAMATKEFLLANGQRLRIAIEPIKLAGSTATLPTEGLQPDINVAVTPAEERAYMNDPFGPGIRSGVSTNGVAGAANRSPRRTRTNEADLVRARREGLELPEESTRLREPDPEPPVIRDPALGRAVDLLKGLAVVRRAEQ